MNPELWQPENLQITMYPKSMKLEFKGNAVKYEYRDFESYIQLSFANFSPEFETKEYLNFWIQLDDIKVAVIMIVKVKFEVTTTGERIVTLKPIKIKSNNECFLINKNLLKGFVRTTGVYRKEITKPDEKKVKEDKDAKAKGVDPKQLSQLKKSVESLSIKQPSEKAGLPSGTVAKSVARSAGVASSASPVREVPGKVRITKRLASNVSPN